ncbi:sensor histidine kinase [Streptosporangium sp. CA-135522]|uniref:sensor histidine kinase n=1 Tax=Streptosporangium sp. CA-135522 TaxID=3240072 RepID=UPI003D909681
MATAPQAVRRHQPWLAVVLTLVGVGATVLSAGSLIFLDLPDLPLAVIASGMLSFYTVLRQLSRKGAWLTAAVAAAFAILFDRTLGRYDGEGLLFIALAVIALSTLGADLRRSRTEIETARADNLETLKKQAAMAERNRIAREMHDIVAHSISMIAVQAETAPYTLPKVDDCARQEFVEIAVSARTTLTEMRLLLGVLRADIPAVAETAPQPGLARLHELIEQHNGQVDLDVIGEQVPMPQAVDVSAYRIVQEALTNARVHAPGARVSIELAYRPSLLVLRITDDGPGPSGAPSDGHGLVGMRERALALGGWFEAGPGPAGGFLIQAGLPLE